MSSVNFVLLQQVKRPTRSLAEGARHIRRLEAHSLVRPVRRLLNVSFCRTLQAWLRKQTHRIAAEEDLRSHRLVVHQAYLS